MRPRGGSCAALAGCARVLAAVAAPAAAVETAGAPAPSSAPRVVGSRPWRQPAPGAIRLVLQKVGGNPLVALDGARTVIRGTVTPYVAGQTVTIGFYHDGREVGANVVSVLALGNGAGQFHVDFKSHYSGAAAGPREHAATAQQQAFNGRAPSVRFVEPDLGPGDRGQSVRLLQSELDALHYAVPLTGFFDEGTGQALVAYRKMTGLERIPYAGREVFKLLARHAGGFRVRYPSDGRHVEANLTKQVLAEIGPDGRVTEIYTTSSGKPSTPTGRALPGL